MHYWAWEQCLRSFPKASNNVYFFTPERSWVSDVLLLLWKMMMVLLTDALVSLNDIGHPFFLTETLIGIKPRERSWDSSYDGAEIYRNSIPCRQRCGAFCLLFTTRTLLNNIHHCCLTDLKLNILPLPTQLTWLCKSRYSKLFQHVGSTRDLYSM